MNRDSIILFVIFVSLTAGCGGRSAATNSTPNVDSVQSNMPSVNAPPFPANANVSVYNSAPTNTAGNAPVQKLPAQSKSGPSKPPTQAAPDNSEVSATLGKDFVQTRTFKDHPKIIKVEETTITDDSNRKVVKVYLKGGKVKEIADGRIANAMTESAENILKAIE